MFKKILYVVLISLFFISASFAQTDKTTPTPVPTASPKPKKPSFRATKDQVTMVQTKLKEAKLYNGEITGKGNAEFKTAVKSWQKDNGLKANGSLNRATLEKMGIELTEKQMLIPVNPSSYAKPKEPKPEKPTTPKPATNAGSTTDVVLKKPAVFRANKDQIMAAQTKLRDGKMLTGGEEGKLDDLTRDGLGKYQDANGLKVTKTLNAATLEKMGIALTDAQKANVAAQAAYDAAKVPKN